MYLDRRRPQSQNLLQGLVPWEVTSLENQNPSILKTLRLSRQGLCWRESSLRGIYGAFRNRFSRPLAWGMPANLACHLSLSRKCHQKRQEPLRPWAWRRLANSERLMCLVVERTLSAAWTARLRALLSSSRSSGSSWMECRCPLAGWEEAVGGHSATGWAEGAEVGPPGDA